MSCFVKRNYPILSKYDIGEEVKRFRYWESKDSDWNSEVSSIRQIAFFSKNNPQKMTEIIRKPIEEWGDNWRFYLPIRESELVNRIQERDYKSLKRRVAKRITKLSSNT